MNRDIYSSIKVLRACPVTWQTVVVYTMLTLLWLDEYFSFHFLGQKTKLKHRTSVAFSSPLEKSDSELGIQQSYFIPVSFVNLIAESWKLNSCVLKRTWKSRRLTTWSKKGWFNSDASRSILTECWISLRMEDGYCTTSLECLTTLIVCGGGFVLFCFVFFLLSTWNSHSLKLFLWPLAHCTTLETVWLLHCIVFS